MGSMYVTIPVPWMVWDRSVPRSLVFVRLPLVRPPDWSILTTNKEINEASLRLEEAMLRLQIAMTHPVLVHVVDCTLKSPVAFFPPGMDIKTWILISPPCSERPLTGMVNRSFSPMSAPSISHRDIRLNRIRVPYGGSAP